MASVKQIWLLKILLFLPFLLLTCYAFFLIKHYRLQQKRAVINSQVGKQFPALALKDRDGNTVSPDLSGTAMTIIDCWYRNCVPCIMEMKQFEKLLKEQRQQIKIISISIDNAEDWKAALDGQDRRFEFMARPVAGWQHLRLDYGVDSTGNNKNALQLAALLKVTSYPSFFVLDNKGMIKATPASAVAYLQSPGGNEYPFSRFLKRRDTWRRYYWLPVFSLIAYLLLWRISRKIGFNHNRPTGIV